MSNETEDLQLFDMLEKEKFRKMIVDAKSMALFDQYWSLRTLVESVRTDISEISRILNDQKDKTTSIEEMRELHTHSLKGFRRISSSADGNDSDPKEGQSRISPILKEMEDNNLLEYNNIDLYWKTSTVIQGLRNKYLFFNTKEAKFSGPLDYQSLLSIMGDHRMELATLRDKALVKLVEYCKSLVDR